MPINRYPESERWTRKQLIDRRLTDAGWKIVPEKEFDPAKPLATYNRCAIEEFATENGPADYGLCAEGRILGVVEAKKLTLGPQNVLSQAERYSKGLVGRPFSFRGYGVPFLYSTNGEVIWHHDISHELSRSREIAHFTPLNEGRLEMIVRRPGVGLREVVETAELTLDEGLVGDSWQHRIIRSSTCRSTS